MKFSRSSRDARGIYLPCMRVTAQRGFFVSVVRFAYRVYASWTSIRLPRAVAARPSRYAYFCAVSHASAVSASRLHRVFQKHENLSYYNFRFFAASPAANCRRAVSLARARRTLCKLWRPRLKISAQKSLFSAASEHKQSHCLFGDAG